jgi:hypothetical protein
MSTRRFIAVLSVSLLVLGCVGWPGATDAGSLEVVGPQLREGDVIFQESRSSQSAALKVATGSRYTHVGLIERRGDAWWVLEAVSPVRRTPLADWVERGVDGHAVVKRPVDSLGAEQLEAVLEQARSFLGRPYDLPFLWSDDALYCSELVYKAYARGAALELTALRRHGDYQLASPEVQAVVRQRYPQGIPVDEPVVAPSDLFSTSALVTVAVLD